MHLVAVDGIQGAPVERVSSLAKLLNLTGYEARQRLVSTPSIVGRFESEEQSNILASRLRDADFRVLLLEPST